VNTFRFPAAVGVLATVAFMALPATMAAAEDWFIPGQGPQQRGASPPPGRPAARGEHERGRPAAVPVQASPAAPAEPAQQGPQVALPPIPQLPALPRGPSPPAAVIGVLGVPEVMRASAAAQQVEKVLGARREKLNQDAQKEQAAWRDMQQALANDRPKLTAEQISKRERELQERITNAQRQFRERNKIIQDAAQYALAQIERTLVAVIRQVAESRGMNLVLHRAQVALNVNEFDITPQVADELNKLLTSVNIPPDGKEPPLASAAPEGAAPAPTAANAAAAPAPAAAAPGPPAVNAAAPIEPPPAAGTAEATAPAPTRK